MDVRQIDRLFQAVYQASDEAQLDSVIERAFALNQISWHPLGGDENYFGVIENQQASPIAALIEKVTNAIDAILMRRCFERGIDPRSSSAPKTMAEAVQKFFGPDNKNWHLTGIRRKQAESIQIIASGPKGRPCLLIYDDGEGQHPDDFERTFLSLLRGNKNDIPFVQGKYNMGGTGAIVFCGRHRYHLIGSRRFDGTGDFGFTLIRKHPLTEEEAKTKKSTWYEYLKIDYQIPRFPITELDLGLWNRKYTTGTIIKLYNYELPGEARGGAITHDFRRSINEFLFEPALPVFLVDSKERYPNDRVLEIDCFGLKRRLEEDDNKYIETKFSIEGEEHDIGRLKVTCYVFKGKVNGRSVKETREIIQREFFRNGMAVLFSLNGQVHGHFTSEFITRTLKMPLLKHHLLVHVDCTELRHEFRNELFMASRDRLKSGDDTADLRERLRNLLLKSDLVEIEKQRKTSISVEGGDAKDLLRAFSKDLPFNKDLMKLLSQTFKIELTDDDRKDKHKPVKPQHKREREPFSPKRYPSYFRLRTGKGDKYITLPEGDEKTIHFATDVADDYFDRSEDPGDLKVAVLQSRRNETEGGTGPGPLDNPDRLLDIRKSSPREGTIRIGFGATQDLRVGDEVEIRAVLSGPEDYECRFWIKIVEARNRPQEVKKPEETEEPPLGLPDYALVYEQKPSDQPDSKTWEDLGNAGIRIDWDVVMHPFIEDDKLTVIYINMDSGVLRRFKSKQRNLTPEQAELAERRYVSSIYFHSIFLYSITKNRKYELRQESKEVDLDEYLRDVFSSYYSEFLLNFGTDQLMQALGD